MCNRVEGAHFACIELPPWQFGKHVSFFEVPSGSEMRLWERREGAKRACGEYLASNFPKYPHNQRVVVVSQVSLSEGGIPEIMKF